MQQVEWIERDHHPSTFNFKPRGSGDRFVMKLFGSFWVLVEEVHGFVKRLHDANDLIVPPKTMENLHTQFPIQHTHLRLCRFLIILGASDNDSTGVFFKRENEHL